MLRKILGFSISLNIRKVWESINAYNFKRQARKMNLIKKFH